MIITYTGRNIDVTEALKNVTEEKLERLEKFFKEDIRTHVTYRVENKSDIIEITITLPDGTILRAEESTPDMYESLDRTVDILERQIRKYKTRLLNHQRGKKESIRFENIKPLEEKEVEKKPIIARKKKFDMQAMTEEEAILQMELLGHDFFIYMNGNTGDLNVMYKRRDGNYGLIEPDI